MLTRSGGVRCDLTVTRGGENDFMVVTGGGSGMHDLAWLRSQLRPDERVEIVNMTDHRYCLGLWGPRARDIFGAVTDIDVSNDAFPYMTVREVNVGEVPGFAQRISYVGELGWELYGPIEMGGRVWDLLWDAGQEHGLIAAGLGAFDSLRLEKGYRLWGQDLNTEHDPLEAGSGFAVQVGQGLPGSRGLGARSGRGSRRAARVHDVRRSSLTWSWARSRSGPAGAWSRT